MPDRSEDAEDTRPPHRRQQRWGLRTLGMLALAFVSMLALGSDYPLLAVVGLVVGFAGAAYCSYKGLKSFTWLPR